MADLAKIVIEATDNTKAGVQSAIGGLQGLHGAVDSVQSKLAMLGGLLGIGAFAAMVMDTIKATADLKKFQEMTGATVEGLSALRSVAKLSGTDFETITGSLTKLSKTLSSALNADSPAAKSLAQLGISAIDAAGNLRKTDDVTLELAKTFAQYADGPGKVAAAMALFGKEGAKMLPVLADLAIVGQYNAKITTEQAAAADELEKNFKRLTASTGGLKTIIGNEMVPALDAFVKTLLQAQNESSGMRDKVGSLAKDGTLSDWAKQVALSIGYAIDGFQYFWRAIQTTGTVIGAAAASLGDFAQLLVGNAVDKLKAGLGGAKDVIKDIWSAPVFSDRLVQNLYAGADATNKAAAALPALKFATKEATDKLSDLDKAWNALLDDLGKAAGTANFQMDFLQRMGVEAKSTKQAAVEFAVTYGALKSITQDEKDAWIGWAKRVDQIKEAEKHLESYYALVKKENEEEVKAANDAAQSKLDTLIGSLDTMRAETARLNVDLIGDDKKRMVAQIDLEKQKWLDIIALYKIGTQDRKDIEEAYAAWLAATVTKAEVDHWKSAMDYGRTTIANLITDWHGGLKKIGADIKTYLVDMLARLAMNQTVIPIVASITGIGASTLSAAMGVNNSPIGSLASAGLSALGSTALGSGFMSGLTGVTGSLAASGTSGVATYMVAAEQAAAGGLSSFGSMLGAMAANPATWIALAAVAAYAIFAQKAGGPKTGGSFQGTYDATGALSSTNPTNLFGLKADESVGNSAVQSIAVATAKSYFEMMKKFGGSAQGLSFGLGYDSDPRGTADNRIKGLVTDAMGNTIFKEWDRAIGRDDKNIGPELQLTASRALLAALQASKLPDEIANILNSVTASGATQTQLDDVFARATAMNDLFGAIGVSMDTALTPMKTAIELIHDQGAALAEFARNSDRSAQSLATLATSTAQYRAQVTALIAQYEDAKTAIGKTIDDTIRGFIFGGLDSQGQYNMLQGEAQGLKGKLGGMTDAATITATIAQIAQLSNQAFGLLSPDQQKAQLQEFITGLRDAQATADTRLSDLQQAAADAANQQLAETRKNIATEAATAETNKAAAEMNLEAAQINSRTAATGWRLDIGGGVATQSGT